MKRIITGHTPGPWHVQTKMLHSELSGTPFNVYSITSRDDYDEYIKTNRVSGIEPDAWKVVTQDIRENEANARLIASSPELLEVLEGVLELAGQPHELCADDYCEAEGYGDGNIEEHKILKRAKELIANAKG